MSVGLDVGCHAMRCWRHRGEPVLASSARSVFAALPDAPNYRELLEAGRVPFALCEGALTLVGDVAHEFAPLFHVRPQCLLPQGRLPTNDPVARQCSAALVEALLGEPDQPGEICCVTLPGGEVSRSLATSNELEFFSRLIRLRGFTPQVLSSGMAAVLASLVHNAFTGIGMSFGASTSEIVVAHRGIELAFCASPRGGDWLDELIAEHFEYFLLDETGQQVLDLDQATAHRMNLTESVALPSNDDQRFLTDIHHDLAYALIRSAVVEFSKERRVLDVPQPLPVVVVGGVARTPGFDDILRNAFLSAEFPLAIRDIHFETADDFTVARGCLINAQLEADVRARYTYAA